MSESKRSEYRGYAIEIWVTDRQQVYSASFIFSRAAPEGNERISRICDETFKDALSAQREAKRVACKLIDLLVDDLAGESRSPSQGLGRNL
jgi:hypothetical protein